MGVQFICIFGIARTGSSRLCKLLDGYFFLNVTPELFHGPFRQPVTQEDLAGLYALSKAANDGELRHWRRRNPAAVLEFLFKSGRDRPMVFKLFPGHLTREVATAQILNRDDVGFVVLRRRPIESFISVCKADITKIYRHVDTTQIKPNIQADEFILWARRQHSWHQWVDEVVASHPSTPSLSMSYERDLLDRDDATVVDFLAETLVDFYIGARRDRRKIPIYPRQDLTQRYQDRVANWDQFSASLNNDPEGAALLSWAERDPIVPD